MRLIHLTDLHLTSVSDESFWRLGGKRRLGYLSWTRKRRRIHRPDVLERLLAAVAAERADQILVTGDLVQLGLPREIEAAGDVLRGLGPPESVMLVPGNHDLYAADSWPAVRTRWHEYLHLPPAAGPAIGDAYPVCRALDGIELIGLSSACPTPALLATGRLGAGQLQRLADRLDHGVARGRLCCLLVHHPPLPGIVQRRKALVDADALERLIRDRSVPLVLHGHVHRNCERRLGHTTVYGTASASSASTGAPAAYRRFDITPERDGWRVRMALKSMTAAPGGTIATVAEDDWRVRLSEPVPA